MSRFWMYTNTNPTLTGATEHHHLHRRIGAIALNNMALMMLTRGFCVEALNTFKDSLLFMRSALNNGSSSTTLYQCVSQEDTRSALDRATKLTVQYQNVDVKATIGRLILETMSTQASLSNVYKDLTTNSSSTAKSCNVQQRIVVYPMTIDPIDFESCSEDDSHFDAAVVLYNYGIACLCALADENATMGAGDVHDHALVQHAHRLFVLSRTIVGRMDANGRIAKYGPTPAPSRILVLLAVLTHNLIYTSSRLDDTTESNNYRCIMQHLLQRVKAQLRVLSSMADPKAAPAA